MNAHEFRKDAEYRTVPYGVYDTTPKEGRAHVGTFAETGIYALTLRYWWRTRQGYPNADAMFIEAGAGGVNSCGCRPWGRELQLWAEDPPVIAVLHCPTRASEWNPGSHRLVGPISIK